MLKNKERKKDNNGHTATTTRAGPRRKSGEEFVGAASETVGDGGRQARPQPKVKSETPPLSRLVTRVDVGFPETDTSVSPFGCWSAAGLEKSLLCCEDHAVTARRRSDCNQGNAL